MTDATAILDTRNLVDALNLVDAVRRAHELPTFTLALANFNDKPHLMAIDIDRELTVFLKASHTGKFQVVIDPPSAITALSNSTGAATVSLDDGATYITTNQVAVRGRKGMNPCNHPTLNTGKPVHNFTITEDTLHAALQAVRFAISTEETRYYLNGVFLTAVDGEMALVATDGHRLARHLMDMPYDGPHVIIPATTVRTLLHLLKRDGDTTLSVTIGVVGAGKGHDGKDTHAIVVDGNSWHLKSRCIDGTYPTWEVVIGTAVDAIGAAPSIRATVTQAQVSRLPKHNGWRSTTLDPDAGTMRVRNDYSEDAVEMPLKGTGAPFRINPRYLRQLVGAVGDVEFTGSAPDAPFIATPKNPKTVVVQMPLKERPLKPTTNAENPIHDPEITKERPIPAEPHFCVCPACIAAKETFNGDDGTIEIDGKTVPFHSILVCGTTDPNEEEYHGPLLEFFPPDSETANAIIARVKARLT